MGRYLDQTTINKIRTVYKDPEDPATWKDMKDDDEDDPDEDGAESSDSSHRFGGVWSVGV